MGRAGTVMRFGVDLPYFADALATRDYAQAVEALGYDHLGFSEHIVSAAADAHPGVPLVNDLREPWHESFTLMGYLAAVTQRIVLNPSVLLLPLYPAALAAKQAAEVDHLTGGRLRLAVSMGWNAIEAQALGVDPATRGARLEEQINVMRALWTQPLVHISGRFHHLDGVGINPRPLQQPIPLWMGGGRLPGDGTPGPVTLRRIAHLADGFKMLAPLGAQPERGIEVIRRLRTALAAAGRDPASFGIEARIIAQRTTPDDWPRLIQLWAAQGVTHIGLSNRIAGGGLDEQLGRVRQFIEIARSVR
jgi:probable F420-dependent oxidoreductase